MRDPKTTKDKPIIQFDQLPDYPAFRDVQRALWGIATVRGAALMVGAGFSRLAVPTASDALPLPLWSDFSQRMATELYPSKPISAPSDPLRLAEEYRAALGQTSLDNLVRELVPDEKWTPGELHRRLVQLPWSDILTTNWDTLLERAASSDPERAYELVTTTQDIPRTRAPRIVKLHGSLPSTLPFIFAQEDYRTYPNRFAPFVNLAQQVLLENELCLVGFSGNDPNFLQWIGWVRDQLGASARPLRLIGVLDLLPSQRALLAKQNITPIDLAPLVERFDGDDRHSEALRLFINELHAGKPSDPGTWVRKITSGTETNNSEIAELLQFLTDDRLNYPGWLAAPPVERQMLRFDTSDAISLIEKNLAKLTSDQLSRAAFELSWRLDQASLPMPNWLIELSTEVLAQPTGISRAEQHQLCIFLAQNARIASNWDKFDHAVTLGTSLALSDDERAAGAYQICLRYRDGWEMTELENHLESVAGSDPAWMLRKAALLSNLMRHKEAARLVRDCAVEIRRRRSADRKSLWLISREAWVHLMVRQASYDLNDLDGRPDGYGAFDEWPHRYAMNRCDPWDELRHLDDSLEKAFEAKAKRAKRDTPLFDAGSFKRRGQGRYWQTGLNVSAWRELNHVVDRVGISRFRHVDFIESRIERSAELLDRKSFEDWLAIARSIHKREDGLIEDVFSRTSVARLPFEVAERLFERVHSVIDYGRLRLWSEDRFDDGDRRPSGWLEEVRLLFEIASRLVVRLPTDKAAAAFRWACEIGHDKEITHWWLYEPLTNLLERCLDAMPQSVQSELALEMVRFPTASHAPEHGMLRYWPHFGNRLAALKTISRSGSGWDSAIATNIELVKSSNLEVRTRAILKLLPLFKHTVLRTDESSAFCEALWAQTDGDNSLPRSNGIFPFVFLNGPEPSENRAVESFRSDVVMRLAAGSFTEVRWTGLAAIPPQILAQSEILGPSDAKSILDHVLELSPILASTDDEGFERRDDSIAMARAMANVVMPALRDAPITEASAFKLMALSEPDARPELIQTLPELTIHHPKLEAQIVDRIHRFLISSQPTHSDAAVHAVLAWSKLAVQTGKPFPAVLATEVAGTCLARRPRSLHGALYAAAQLGENDQLSTDDLTKLSATLGLLFIETDYQNVEHTDPLATTLTLVRKQCVRLASALTKAGVVSEAVSSWLEIADDTMPEVRFALVDGDE